MVGIHSISVLCEAALKHVKGVDRKRVLEACSSMLSQPTYGMSLWDEYGYLPADKVNWSVSVELEYCINARCIALLARDLGEDELAEEFEKRAQRYRRHFDARTGFMRGVNSMVHSPNRSIRRFLCTKKLIMWKVTLGSTRF